MSLVTFTRCDYWNDKGISSLLDENLAKGIFLDIFGYFWKDRAKEIYFITKNRQSKIKSHYCIFDIWIILFHDFLIG